MNRELKAKWVAALRSGEYLQGFGQLSNGDVYCCLGVFCQANGIDFDMNKDDGDEFGPKELFDALDWETRLLLISMNDGVNKSFAEIADYIEANL